MSQAWFAGILRVCHVARVVALVDVLELAACWSLCVAWFATSEVALSTLAQVLVVEAGWHCCCHCLHSRHNCECWPSDDNEVI
jgi:hypothetical protein